jgi:hypothetical protein
MKQLRVLLKTTYVLLVLFSGLVFEDVANAGKLALSGGAYSFSAENASNRVTATLSGLGSYQIAYRYAVQQNIELDFGFSLLATDTFGGDLSFGLDVGANYFFMTSAGAITSDSADGNIVLNHRWRPFAGVSFNQRNFQSTSSQYAGFGLKGGTEYQYDEQFALHGTIRYLSLGGPNQAGATQLDILTGIIIQF